LYVPSSQELAAEGCPNANNEGSLWLSLLTGATVLSTRGHRIDSPEASAMFRISDTIRRTETVDGGVLLDIHHGQMFCLNVTGAKILESIRLGYDESRIAEEIGRDYGVSREVVCADVHDFIESLHRHHILQPR
jgi:hypothetical protein